VIALSQLGSRRLYGCHFGALDRVGFDSDVHLRGLLPLQVQSSSRVAVKRVDGPIIRSGLYV